MRIIKSVMVVIGVLCALSFSSRQAAAITWSMDTVIDGQYSSIVMDGSGSLHLAYYDFRAGSLKYAVKSGGTWSTQVVDGPGYRGMYPSLVLDASGNPHISYYDYWNGDMKYASLVGTAWQITTVDSVGNVGMFSSLALDSSGNPHISYYDYGNGKLKYASMVSGNWSVEVVDSDSDVGQYSSIALDPSGKPVISYYDYTKGDLKCADWDGTQWHRVVIDSDGNVGQFTSLAIDASGTRQISYYKTTSLAYAGYKNGSWATEVVDSSTGAGYGTAMSVGDGGVVHIAYYVFGTHDLKYAARIGGLWTTSTVDAAGDVGQNPAICLDTAGAPLISCFDATNLCVKIASVQYTDDISAARKPDTDIVSVGGQVVTAAYDGYFYIEAPDRSAGIRVDRPAHGLSAGQTVNVAGKPLTNGDGERYIAAVAVGKTGLGSVGPFGMSNKSVGGTDLLSDGKIVQCGVLDGSGPNNIGRLIKVWGKITQKDPSGSYVYIDDGSGLLDGSYTGSAKNTGVRVAMDGNGYKEGDFLAITGVSSCFRNKTTGEVCRLVRVSSVSEIPAE
ncbi:MAG: hypothetical protein ABFD64_10715 [Armatimonadota bacterium]